LHQKLLLLLKLLILSWIDTLILQISIRADINGSDLNSVCIQICIVIALHFILMLGHKLSFIENLLFVQRLLFKSQRVHCSFAFSEKRTTLSEVALLNCLWILLLVIRGVIRVIECALLVIFSFLWIPEEVSIVAEIAHECVLLRDNSLSNFIWHWSYLLARWSEIWLHNSPGACDRRLRSSIYWTSCFITIFIIFMLLYVLLQPVLVYLIWSAY
jgi:hypothetical protein